ncbi:histidine ammonia-lyase [Dongia soli]|uniref:Histidine ammonia-lyase n=1 Tax=Dongia soli TaxID=600628 RepID=A0ABU5EAU1_9PROT|nr:histidine ammonia-lyase [Dongia soli]MDY0882981.1 histidine ammonia-lyase [Dongia soli]
MSAAATKDGNGSTSVIERGEAALSYRQLVAIANGASVAISPAVQANLANARRIVERIIAKGERAYGISTGLGALCNVLLSGDQQAELSRNTLLSHACGVGAPLPVSATRAIMASLLNDLCHAKSGASPAVPAQLAALLNADITPLVPGQGSVGYITHGAHVGLALIGIGDVQMRGRQMSASEALAAAGLEPITLGAKDGLCLVNGTRCLTGLACLALAEAEHVADWADVTGALSFEALKGQIDAFDPQVLALKPHPGLLWVGERLRALLSGSEIIAKHRGVRTQDALSLRSIPQIHGATRDQIDHVRRQIEIELGSATDNPLVIGTEEDYRVISNAHPHGQSLAMAVDLLSIAIAELGSVAERRLDRLINPAVSDLPAFLVQNGGVNSGMMITQYVATSLAAENKLLAQPMVTDNYITSAQQEDHLSLGTPGALKCLQVIANTRKILAIEYLLAAQAMEFYPGLKRGAGTEAAYAVLRQRISAYSQDRFLAPDMAAVDAAMAGPDWLSQILATIGAA